MGRRSDLLFIHGLAGSSRYWDSIADSSIGYRGVAVDLIGFGQSPKPHDFTYDVEAQIDAIHDVCPNPDVVVGHSIGTIITAAYVKKYAPSAATILIGTPAFTTPAEARTHLRELGWLAEATVTGTRTARLLCRAMCALRPLAMLVADLATRLPHLQLRRVDSADHHVALTHPRLVADIITELLTRRT